VGEFQGAKSPVTQQLNSKWQDPARSASVHAFRSLRARHLAQAASALHLFSVGWTVQPHEDCHGNLMIVVLPDLDDPTAPSFVLDGEEGAVKLGMVGEDAFEELGEFDTVRSAMYRIALISVFPPDHGRQL
jgi:hypothetical protein